MSAFDSVASPQTGQDDQRRQCGSRGVAIGVLTGERLRLAISPRALCALCARAVCALRALSRAFCALCVRSHARSVRSHALTHRALCVRLSRASPVHSFPLPSPPPPHPRARARSLRQRRPHARACAGARPPRRRWRTRWFFRLRFSERAPLDFARNERGLFSGSPDVTGSVPLVHARTRTRARTESHTHRGPAVTQGTPATLAAGQPGMRRRTARNAPQDSPECGAGRP